MTILDDADILGPAADLRDESQQVRAALSALGRLLGAAIARPPRNLGSFVAENLAVAPADVTVVSAPLTGLDAPLVRVAVARLLEDVRGLVATDDTGTAAPGYELVTVDVGVDVAAPDDLAAYLPAGEVFDFDAVLRLSYPGRQRTIALHVRRSDQDRARRELTALIVRARTVDNFYRGRTLATNNGEWGIEFEPVAPLTGRRNDVVHTDAVWAEIDANIGGLARHADALLAAGLGASRGVLVAGPPGVGKTALCRVIAAELAPGTTIVLVQPGVSPHALAELYEAASGLEPAAVFLDDIDLVAGTRRGGGGGGPMLGEFLTRMDGLRGSARVVTVATTNVTESLDPALLRPGRFDAVIEIGPPDRPGRAEILRRYLAPITDVDVEPVAAATAGATGADLREIVRRTVLERGAVLTVSDLLDVVRSARWKPEIPTGQYL